MKRRSDGLSSLRYGIGFQPVIHRPFFPLDGDEVCCHVLVNADAADASFVL